jgi:hypothetical protein
MSPLTRRGFLGTAGAAFFTLSSTSLAAGAAPDAFMKLSAFRADGGFDAELAALGNAVAGSDSMDAFLLRAPDAALLRTATQVVSAWYLGVVGTGAAGELIAYEDALMYRPTAGMAVIPSYCVGPSYWAAAAPSEPN